MNTRIIKAAFACLFLCNFSWWSFAEEATSPPATECPKDKGPVSAFPYCLPLPPVINILSMNPNSYYEDAHPSPRKKNKRVIATSEQIVSQRKDILCSVWNTALERIQIMLSDIGSSMPVSENIIPNLDNVYKYCPATQDKIVKIREELEDEAIELPDPLASIEGTERDPDAPMPPGTCTVGRVEEVGAGGRNAVNNEFQVHMVVKGTSNSKIKEETVSKSQSTFVNGGTRGNWRLPVGMSAGQFNALKADQGDITGRKVCFELRRVLSFGRTEKVEGAEYCYPASNPPKSGSVIQLGKNVKNAYVGSTDPAKVNQDYALVRINNFGGCSKKDLNQWLKLNTTLTQYFGEGEVLSYDDFAQPIEIPKPALSSGSCYLAHFDSLAIGAGSIYNHPTTESGGVEHFTAQLILAQRMEHLPSDMYAQGRPALGTSKTSSVITLPRSIRPFNRDDTGVTLPLDFETWKTAIQENGTGPFAGYDLCIRINRLVEGKSQFVQDICKNQDSLKKLLESTKGNLAIPFVIGDPKKKETSVAPKDEGAKRPLPKELDDFYDRSTSPPTPTTSYDIYGDLSGNVVVGKLEDCATTLDFVALADAVTVANKGTESDASLTPASGGNGDSTATRSTSAAPSPVAPNEPAQDGTITRDARSTASAPISDPTSREGVGSVGYVSNQSCDPSDASCNPSAYRAEGPAQEKAQPPLTTPRKSAAPAAPKAERDEDKIKKINSEIARREPLAKAKMDECTGEEAKYARQGKRVPKLPSCKEADRMNKELQSYKNARGELLRK